MRSGAGRRAVVGGSGSGSARGAAGYPGPHGAARRRRCRPGADRGPLPADHLAQPGTLHLVRSEDYPWLHALTTPPLLSRATPAALRRRASARRRRARRRDDREGAGRGGAADPAQLRERLDSAGVRTEGQALVHLLFLATLRGHRGAGPDGRLGARLRPDPRLARAAAAGRPRGRPRRAGPPLPGRPRAGGRPRPRPLGGPAAARCPRRPLLRSPPSWPSAGRARRSRQAGGAGAASTAAPARRLRSASARLDLARGSRRPAQAAGDDQRDLPSLRPGQGSRCGDLATGGREGDDRAARAGHQEGRQDARGRGERSAAFMELR